MKIFADGKLNNKKTKRIIIWAVISIEIEYRSLSKLIYNNIEFIIINCSANKPLKPSIKLQPFIINKKHKTIKKI
tara:strand:- start:106 stop:330 length:225 start_codon:yes stop_codon:yes gene_type:complete